MIVVEDFLATLMCTCAGGGSCAASGGAATAKVVSADTHSAATQQRICNKATKPLLHHLRYEKSSTNHHTSHFWARVSSKERVGDFTRFPRDLLRHAGDKKL